MRVSEDVEEVEVAMTYSSSLFGKVKGESGKPAEEQRAPITGQR